MKAISTVLFILFALAPSALGQAAPGHAVPAQRTLTERDGWSLIRADGVDAAVTPTAGGGIRLDWDFSRGAGYAVARLEAPIEVPGNFRLSMRLRGEGPANNLEVKLVTGGGDEVWWVHRRAFEWPAEFTHLVSKRRHFTFAWGPSHGREPLRRVEAIEIAVAAWDGGRGFVEFEDLRLEPIAEDMPYTGTPKATVGDAPVPLGADGRLGTAGAGPVVVDFGAVRELSGLLLTWGEGASEGTEPVTIELRRAGGDWQTVRTTERAMPGAQAVLLRETDAAAVRVTGGGRALTRFEVLEPADAPTPNAAALTLATRLPEGWMPAMFHGRQRAWSVFGVADNPHEGLLGADGRVELDAGGPSIEPFLRIDGHGLRTWADGSHAPSLRAPGVPMPMVTRTDGDLRLDIEPLAVGESGGSAALVRYRVVNGSRERVSGDLFLALRPHQVLPPWHELNRVGGLSRVRAARADARTMSADGWPELVAFTPADGAGAASSDLGEPAAFAEAGGTPDAASADDAEGRAWAMQRFAFDLAPGKAREIVVGWAWSADPPSIPADDAAAAFDRLAETHAQRWREALSRTIIELGGAGGDRWADAARATLGWILINMDGPATQPGSRTYERAWIRDGAITGTALMSLGYGPEVGAFAEWYAGYQYANGKVPCVVDRRGPDPVDEHDSTGQLIHVITRQARVAGDAERARRLLPNVRAGLDYLDDLRRQRMTEEFRGTKFWGMVPESISHEGYAAKPMHSYWDGFFVILGLKDAALLARELGDAALAERAQTMLDEYREAMYHSMRLSMLEHRIDYIPGCAELGDFDAPSTAIGVDPVGELGRIPEPELHNTFDRYWAYFLARRDGEITWRDYSAYEMRIAAALVRMGQLDRAWEQIDWMLADQRPVGWDQWPEVTYRDPEYPGFLGDMPHTWVAAGYVNALVTMLAYEDDDAGTLIVGAGLRPEWLREDGGVRVERLGTVYGPLTIAATQTDATFRLAFEGLRTAPDAGVLVRLPAGEWADVRVDGEPAEILDGAAVVRATSGVVTATK